MMQHPPILPQCYLHMPFVYTYSLQEWHKVYHILFEGQIISSPPLLTFFAVSLFQPALHQQLLTTPHLAILLVSMHCFKNVSIFSNNIKKPF